MRGTSPSTGHPGSFLTRRFPIIPDAVVHAPSSAKERAEDGHPPPRVDPFACARSQRLGWRKAAVAGCSMGGNVAQAFAAEYPQRTTALGLIDTTAWYGADAAAKFK